MNSNTKKRNQQNHTLDLFNSMPEVPGAAQTGDGRNSLPSTDETPLPALGDIVVHRTEPFWVPGLSNMVHPLPLFSVRLQRTGTHLTREIISPSDAARVACEMLEDRDREHLLVFALSAAGRLVAANVAHVGGLDSSICGAREIYRFAILAVAKSIIVVHNHPSGEVEPSKADLAVTKLLKAAGDVTGIPLRDHLITGFNGEYTSLAERGLI